MKKSIITDSILGAIVFFVSQTALAQYSKLEKDISYYTIKFKQILISILLLFVLYDSTAQIQNKIAEQTVKKNAVYYELFGNGLFAGSVNYDRLIPLNEKSGLILRGGLSWYEKIFPLGEINYMTGNQKHHFETALVIPHFMKEIWFLYELATGFMETKDC